ncbi:hypothetical protein HS088_TW07G00037 [Tripterygium wilfordii]|uniref:Methyltransferase type 11 domain-containing protein n=1 Tax=Tripterygium wilfordii TaxID=458696 RepID=A0A7J7DEG6_TRIWF|nr:uncharacterized protein LOC120001969 [Tripterygium wilfordii]KAF5744466.1 hypothetical protein HS088_TW07G00037 [Tripterygium wilfordii]
MDLLTSTPGLARNILFRILSFCVIVFAIRFAYTVTIKGVSCDSGDFCFFPKRIGPGVRDRVIPSTPVSISRAVPLPDVWTTKRYRKALGYYSSIFRDLISEGYLSPNSKSLCIGTLIGEDVEALREIGVKDSIGLAKKASPPLILGGLGAHSQPFDENTFDFEFSGNGVVEQSRNPVQFASEISRMLKPGGFLVVHTKAKDAYSLHSFLNLFNCCRLVKSREMDGLDSSIIREIILRKELEMNSFQNGSRGTKCSIPGYKREIIKKAEPFIEEEPLKPWITLKRNIKNFKYLTSKVDITFKNRYIYIDVGARNYGSSIGNWFKKQYPKQNKSFEIYAIEADQAFHEEYRTKKGVTLLPFAAWVRNETLFFEITRNPGKKFEEKSRGMGRIQQVQSSANYMADIEKIQGFDFAEWLKKEFTESDFIVMKMDVDATEFHLIPRLVETRAICLIDEMFLECHYNRWQRCCPGQRRTKYQKTYSQCLDLLRSLREIGVLVHQWW